MESRAGGLGAARTLPSTSTRRCMRIEVTSLPVSAYLRAARGGAAWRGEAGELAIGGRRGEGLRPCSAGPQAACQHSMLPLLPRRLLLCCSSQPPSGVPPSCRYCITGRSAAPAATTPPPFCSCCASPRFAGAAAPPCTRLRGPPQAGWPAACRAQPLCAAVTTPGMWLMALSSAFSQPPPPLSGWNAYPLREPHSLQAVPEQQDERQALPGLVGAGAGLGGLQRSRQRASAKREQSASAASAALRKHAGLRLSTHKDAAQLVQHPVLGGIEPLRSKSRHNGAPPQPRCALLSDAAGRPLPPRAPCLPQGPAAAAAASLCRVLLLLLSSSLRECRVPGKGLHPPCPSHPAGHMQQHIQ